MRKKILIISGTFYPKNSPRSFRTTELVKEFSKLGHHVTVFIPNKNEEHFEFEEKYNVKIQNLGTAKFKDIDISRGGKFLILFKRVLRRLLTQLFVYPEVELAFQVRRALKKNKESFDLMISIAAPHSIHWGVASYRTTKKSISKVWVADCGDPFMGSTTDTFGKMFYFKFVEKWWCRKADYISVPFEGAIEGYYPEFHNKINVIPQGFKFEEVADIVVQNSISNKVPTFAYAGLLIPGSRDPKPMIDFIVSLNLDFKFIFYTQSTGMLAAYKNKYKDQIELRNYIPRMELLHELSKMDFLVNFDNKVTTQLPSKLIDYYLIQRPVLSINSFNFDKEVVEQFLNGNYSKRFIYNNPDKYRIENVTKQFLELV